MSSAVFIAYSLQSTLSVAIVAMVEKRNDTDANSTVPIAAVRTDHFYPLLRYTLGLLINILLLITDV